MKFTHLFIYKLKLLQLGLRFDHCTYGAYNSVQQMCKCPLYDEDGEVRY